ncbi:Clp protease N-terminal domain-containing protein, partial [Aeromonas sp. sif2416]
ALCVNHQGAEIRIEHLLLKMLDTPLSDVRQILKRAEVEVEELKTLLQPSHADSGYGQGYPSFSPLLVEWLQDSWLLASAELQHAQLRSGVMLLVLLMTPQRYLPGSVTRLLANVNRELLRQQFDEWV